MIWFGKAASEALGTQIEYGATILAEDKSNAVWL